MCRVSSIQWKLLPPFRPGVEWHWMCVYGGVKIINNQSMVSTFQWQLPPPLPPGWMGLYVCVYGGLENNI